MSVCISVALLNYYYSSFIQPIYTFMSISMHICIIEPVISEIVQTLYEYVHDIYIYMLLYLGVFIHLICQD